MMNINKIKCKIHLYKTQLFIAWIKASQNSVKRLKSCHECTRKIELLPLPVIGAVFMPWEWHYVKVYKLNVLFNGLSVFFIRYIQPINVFWFYSQKNIEEWVVVVDIYTHTHTCLCVWCVHQRYFSHVVIVTIDDVISLMLLLLLLLRPYLSPLFWPPLIT